MSIQGLIDAGGQLATITAEAPDRRTPGQTAAGGADRSDANWLTVVDGVPCLVWHQGSSLDTDHNDQRAGIIQARIYFADDPAPPPGLSSRHRITVTESGPEDNRRVLGIYAVQGARRAALGSQDLLMADCERIRIP